MAEAAPGWSSYRFGFNNPIRYSDPTGLYESERKARRAWRRAKRLGYNVGNIYGGRSSAKKKREFGFSLGNGSHAFKNKFWAGSSFAQFFNPKTIKGSKRAGITLMTGMGNNNGGADPEGTSDVIIDGMIVPFGGNFGAGGDGLVKWGTHGLDAATDAISTTLNIDPFLEGEGEGFNDGSSIPVVDDLPWGYDTIYPEGRKKFFPIEKIPISNGYNKKWIRSEHDKEWEEVRKIQNGGHPKEGKCFGCSGPQR